MVTASERHPPVSPSAWGGPAQPGTPGIALAALVGGLAVVVAVTGVVTSSWIVAAGVGLVVAGAGFVWTLSLGRRTLRSVGARLPAPDEAPRLNNLSDGLATRLGIEPPALLVADDEAVNALVCRAPGATLVVTTGCLRSLTRTELEAVVAHLLVRIAPGGRTAGWTSSAGLGGGPPVGAAEDIAAAGVTRYPPALAAAIAKAEPVQRGPAGAWFVGDERSHEPPERRIARLRDL